jgi:hypothetical protein
MSWARVAIVLAVVAATGCAVFAPKREYRLFRAITETQDVAKLVKYYQMYTMEYPDGAYAEKLAVMRPAIEQEIFMSAGEDQYKLMTYIELFPDGIYATLAGQKIQQIQYMESMNELQQQQILADQQAAKEAAEKARADLLATYWSALGDWTDIALLEAYGMSVEDLASLSPRFTQIWSSDPVAVCSPTSCTKHLVVETWYQIPGATRVDRKNEIVVKMVFASGVLLGYSVTFPYRGVVGLLEMQDGVPYDLDEDTLDMATALAYGMIAAKIPEGSESGMDGAMWAWSVPGANIAFVREGGIESEVTDSLVVQLVAPPPPEPEPPVKGKKPKKKTDEPEIPPPPMATLGQLRWIPAPPPAPAAPPVAPLVPVAPLGAPELPPAPPVPGPYPQ